MASTQTSGTQAPLQRGVRRAVGHHRAGHLELGPARGAEPGRLARRAWSATWPKLLAVAIVLGAWELFYVRQLPR